MDKLFLQIINMSITSSYVILFVLVIRMLLRKFPKIFSYTLWSVVLFRLVFPFSIEGMFSLVPINRSSVPVDIVYTTKPEINSGITVIDKSVNNMLPYSTPMASANPMQIWLTIGKVVWIMGILFLIVYCIFTTVKLHKKLRNATLITDNIYETDKFMTPFVFGIIRPKIYLPVNLSETEKTYITLHEQTHIKRFDHLIKLISFLVTCVHWFNPFVWIAFFLMSEDMELSCDESVIRKMGINIKREYSSSLLSLSTGKRIIGGCPVAFGENNTKVRIKNVLNYKKPKFWVIAIAIVIIIILAMGLITNPPDDGNLSNNSTVEDYAWQYIDSVIESYNNAKFGSFKTIDKKISKLEQLSTFDNILPNTVELWRLEYRLKPENIDEVMIAGGMDVDDGWITEDSSMGKPYLVFTYEGNRLIYLGNAYTSEFDINSLSTQEVAIRIMLENKGLLPKETYLGNHVVIKFPLSTGETCQLLLSQPVKQGSAGIWAVERWMDGNGAIYHEVPNLQGDNKIQDYYMKLQDEGDNGHKPWILDPVEVGYNYIINTLGQILVTKAHLEIINPATIEDFLNTPESHYIGYITMMNMDNSLFHLDKVEFLSLEDVQRAAELNIDVNSDMPSGFYIYNNDNYPTAFQVYDGTEYLILDSANLSNYISVSKKEFIEYIDASNNNPLFHIYTRDGYVTTIKEQYIP